MTHGRTIRIFLSDGTATGVRHVEVVNWSGQAVVCPRSRIGELRDWPESKTPGVYLLLGASDEEDREKVYVGEAENVLVRLTQHSERDFWREAILFTSKDFNLTKSHVKYLESRIYQLARAASRYDLANSNEPQTPALPRPDVHAMEEFIDNIRLLLGALGHRLLEPLVGSPLRPDDADQMSTPLSSDKQDPERRLYLRTNHAQATGIQTDEGLVVLKGSRASVTTAPSLSTTGYGPLRERLIKDSVMVPSNGSLLFDRNYLFSSASAAASVVAGAPKNGLAEWTSQAGVPLGRLQKTTTDSIIKDAKDAGEDGPDTADSTSVN